MSDHQDLPAITLEEIRAWTDEASYGRGASYFRQSRIRSPRRYDRTLQAECLGSRPEPYLVKITLGESGIVAGNCSCPVGMGGSCKHAVALLLTWFHTPEAFAEAEPPTSVLNNLTRDELIALIEGMIERHPDLETMLTLKAISSPAPTQTLDPETIRRQATRALFSHGHDWRSGYHISEELSGIVVIADALAQREDWTNAALVYRTIAETVRDNYEQIYDDEGDVTWVVASCVAGLGNCLAATPDLSSRLELLRAIFNLYLWDVSLGGYGMAGDAPTLLLNSVRPDERRTLVSWLHEALPPKVTEDAFSRDWRRQTLGAFLLALEQDHLDDDHYLELCRDTGRDLELVERLLVLGRVEEAIAETRSAPGYLLTQLADLFVDYGYGDRIRSFVADLWEEGNDRRLLAWLKADAEHHGQLERALEWTTIQFWHHPKLEAYQELRRLAEPLGRWHAVRAGILSRLDAEGYDVELVRIYLEEGAAELALRAFEKLQEKQREPRGQTPFPDRWSSHYLHVPLAEAIAVSHPWKAVALLKEVIDRLIAARGRGNYAEAARHLQTVRGIYLTHGASEEWQVLIDDVRNRNRRLRALRDELEKAGI